jgi:adenylate cyclase
VPRVLEAARECRKSVAAMTYSYQGETLANFKFGLALHIGKVLYGNIGGGDRLDFTCIGPAVNLAARIEKIAGRLNRTVLASTALPARSMRDGPTRAVFGGGFCRRRARLRSGG